MLVSSFYLNDSSWNSSRKPFRKHFFPVEMEGNLTKKNSITYVFLGILKSDSHFPKKLFNLLLWKPFKNDESTFSFVLNAVFVLKLFIFLSWLFGHLEKMAWSKRRLISKLWRYILINKQLQYTYCSRSHEVKATRQWNLYN